MAILNAWAVSATCTHAPAPASAPKELTVPDHVTVAYAASGGFARTDARFALDESGGARMFLGSSTSLPSAGELDRVGAFEGKVDAALRKRLLNVVSRLPETLGDTGPAVPGSVVRSLMLTINGQARELTIPGVAPPPVDELERILQQAMTKLLAHPAEAVSVALDVKDDGPTLALSSVGTRPVTVRLIDDDGRITLRGSVVLMSEQGEMYGSEVLSPDAVSALMREGVLPAGRAALAPGASVRIGLPKPGGAPATGPLVLAGGLDLEVESAGVLRPVSVQAKTVPLRR